MPADLATVLLRLAVPTLDLAAARLERLGFRLDDIAQDPGRAVFSQWLTLGPIVAELASPPPGQTTGEAMDGFLADGPGLWAIQAHWQPFVGGGSPESITARVRETLDGHTYEIAAWPLAANILPGIGVAHLSTPIPVPKPEAHANAVTQLLRVSVAADNPLAAATRLAAAAEIQEIAVGNDQAEVRLGDLRVHFAAPILIARHFRGLSLGERLFGAKALSLVSSNLGATAEALGEDLHAASLPGHRLLVDSAAELGLILEIVGAGEG